MADSDYTFDQARARLEEIVAQVRKKDVSLEKSLDLLEEGVRLANICTELSDHTEWRTVVEDVESSANDAASESESADATVDGEEPADESSEVSADDLAGEEGLADEEQHESSEDSAP